MNFKSYIFGICAFVFFLTGCSEEDNHSKGDFQTGVFILNEGNFSKANGSISFLNLATAEVTPDIFGRVNNNRALGDVVQSMTIDGDKSYIVVNNSNKIEVVNANTFESLAVIDLSLPRNFMVHNGKGYATEWVSFIEPGRVSVIDLNDYSITTTIPAGFGADKMIAVDNHLFVSNNLSNTVSVIDFITEEVIETIEVGNSPAAFVKDKNGKLWVICSGGYNENFEPLNDGKLVQLDPVNFSVMKSIETSSQISSQLLIDNAGEHLLFSISNGIYKVNIGDTAVPDEPYIFEENASGFYGIAIDPVTEWIYASDALSFSANGKVYRYNEAGEKVDVTSAGIGPNNFVFKY